MAKTKTIRDLLEAAPVPPKSGPVTWYGKLGAAQPSLMKEVDEVIDAFWRGEDWVIRKRPTKTALAEFLKPITKAGLSSIVRYIDERANGVKK